MLLIDLLVEWIVQKHIEKKLRKSKKKVGDVSINIQAGNLLQNYRKKVITKKQINYLSYFHDTRRLYVQG